MTKVVLKESTTKPVDNKINPFLLRGLDTTISLVDVCQVRYSFKER